jgi:hypothetical protein
LLQSRAGSPAHAEAIAAREGAVEAAHGEVEGRGAVVVARRGADRVAPSVLERGSCDVPAGDVAVDAGLVAGVAELDDDAVDGCGGARVVEEVEDELVLLA